MMNKETIKKPAVIEDCMDHNDAVNRTAIPLENMEVGRGCLLLLDLIISQSQWLLEHWEHGFKSYSNHGRAQIFLCCATLDSNSSSKELYHMLKKV
jgi:hypothetical protein